jgi:hypothetical protein
MRIDDLIDTLFRDIARPPSVDANSPGEMVRSSLAGNMPGTAARSPMSLSGAPVAPVVRSAMPPVSAPAPSMPAPSRVGAAPMPAPAAPSAPSTPSMNPLGTFSRGYREGGLFGAVANMFDEPAALERASQEKAQGEARAGQLQNLTVRALKSRNPNMADDEAMFIATSGDQALLRKYLEPQAAVDPLDRQRKELELEKLRAEVAGVGGSGREALLKGAPSGTMWNDPNDPSKGVKPIPGAEKLSDPKEYQTKDAMLAERMLRSNDIIEKLMTPKTAGGVGYDPTRGANAWAPDGGIMGGILNSGEWKQYQGAAREGIAAILRKDTGAAVTDQEFEWYFPMFYPQPNDDAQTVADKKARRQAAAQALRGSSGPAFDKMFPDGPIGAATPPAPAGGGVRPVKITGDDHYNALPPGTQFIDPEGNLRVKP